MPAHGTSPRRSEPESAGAVTTSPAGVLVPSGEAGAPSRATSNVFRIHSYDAWKRLDVRKPLMRASLRDGKPQTSRRRA